MRAVLSALIIAFVASGSLTGPVRQLALRLGMVDRPGLRKVHSVPIPLLGGLAIYAGAVPAVVFSVNSSARTQILGILGGATLLAVVGILDDRGLLHHQIKLFGGMPLAAILLMLSGIRADFASVYDAVPWGPLLESVITLFWVVGITAAFSILDHMDGLCAGVAAVASAFFMVLSLSNGQILVATLAGAIIGAAIGFLGWNFNPAKIFMGDGGAMFLGFMMAALGLKLRVPGSPAETRWMVPILVLGVPILDTLLVIVSRTRRGLVPFASPGKDHIAHRLANLGLGQRGAVLALYGLGCLSGSLALLIAHLAVARAYILVSGVAVGAVAAIGLLEHAPFERQDELPSSG